MTTGFCSRAMDWLSEPERAALTGWTRRVSECLAHLADAWTSADPDNAMAVVEAIGVLITRSRQSSQRATWRTFVVSCAGGPREHGGRGSELLEAVDAWLEEWGPAEFATEWGAK